MCLHIKKNTKPRVAEADIVVYKHVIPSDRRKNMFMTSYQFADVFLGETYHSSLERGPSEKTIERGLHSYRSLEAAKRKARRWKETLVKCIIPKGSIYYTGTFSAVRAYASDTLKYVEVL